MDHGDELYYSVYDRDGYRLYHEDNGRYDIHDRHDADHKADLDHGEVLDDADVADYQTDIGHKCLRDHGDFTHDQAHSHI